MAVYKIDVRVDVENSLENFKKDLADLVKRADTAPHKIKVQLDRESFEKEIADLKKSVSSISSTNLGTTIKTAPIKKEATEVVSVFDQIEDRIKAIGGGQDALLRMQNALSSIKPVLEEDKRLAAEFYTATNQVYSGRFFEQLAYAVGAYSDKILDASQLTQQFDDIIKAQVSTMIPAPIQVDDTQIKQLRTLQSVLKKASLEVEEFTTVKKNTSWGMSTARLLSVIEQNASDAQLKVLGLKRSFNSLSDVKGLLIGLATGTQGVSYNDGFGLDSFKTSTTQIRDAISSLKEMNQRVEQDNAALIELRDNLTNTFGNLPADPNGNGALLVTLEQLRQVCNEAPAAFQYIDEIERKLNMSLYENRGVTETPISQIKTEAEEAANSEEHLMTVTQKLTETVSDGIGGNGFVPNLDDIQQAVNGIVDSIKTLNSELQKIKQVDTPTSRGIRGGSRGNQSVLSIAQEEELAYAEWNKIQKEQQRVHDQTIISWNKVGDAAEKEEQRIERATQREIESHYKAEQASEEAAFKELEARRAAEEKKQSEIARSLADFETKLQKEEADVLAATQKELGAYVQYEKSREAKIEKENEKLFQSHVKVSSQRRELEEQRAHEENEAYQSGLRKAEQAVAKEVELERQKYRQELDALEEYERAREAKIEKENDKLFQAHVSAGQKRRELEEQKDHQENEAYQTGLHKAEQRAAKEIELEREKYQAELDELEKYERAREAKIEKENDKLFQAHVSASQNSKWKSQGLTASNIDSLFGKAEKNQDLFKDIDGGFDAVREKYRQLIQLQEQWKAGGSNATAPEVESITKLRKELKGLIEERLADTKAAKQREAETKKQTAAETKRQSLLKQMYDLLTRLKKEEENWSAAKNGKSSGAYSNLQQYQQKLGDLIHAAETIKTPEGIEKISSQFATLTKRAAESEHVIRANGEATQTWRDRLGGLVDKFTSWFGITRVIMAAVRAVRQLIASAKEIDSALTQLKIVTNATNEEMEAFANTAIDLAHNLGKSVAELTKSIETFSRLGYSLNDAAELAKYATIMSNVAGVSTEEATTGLTSIIKGYDKDVEDAEHVADILVTVGQKYAVSAAEMMEAYEKSGAALHATNTSLEKSAGLIAAANASVQDASVVGK